MSSRPTFFLWVSVHVRKKEHRFRFFFPIPLFLALAFMDMVDDIASLSTLFCPHASYRTAANGVQPVAGAARAVTGTMLDLIWELVFFTGPLDLVDVDVQGPKEIVKIKVLTR